MGAVQPSDTSRYLFTDELELDGDEQIPDGTLMWDLPEPVNNLNLPDDIEHTVSEGETLFTLAAKYFSTLSRPSGLFWVLADYQSPPIGDPLLPLPPGSVLKIPSIRTLQEVILSEERDDMTPEMLATEIEL